MHCELARQLEYLVSDWLSDCAWHVPAFLRAMHAALAAAMSTSGRHAAAVVESAVATALHAHRPNDVGRAVWDELWEFVACRLDGLIGAERMLDFTHDLLHTGRFEQLSRRVR